MGEGWGQQHHCLVSGGGQAPWGRKLAFFPCTGGALASRDLAATLGETGAELSGSPGGPSP